MIPIPVLTSQVVSHGFLTIDGRNLDKIAVHSLTLRGERDVLADGEMVLVNNDGF